MLFIFGVLFWREREREKERGRERKGREREKIFRSQYLILFKLRGE